jgi:hypothetical protein
MRTRTAMYALFLSITLSGCAGFSKGFGSSAEVASSTSPVKLVVSPPSAPVAATAPTPPPVDRRRPIQSTGYAVISIQPHSLPAQQRLLAIRAARLDAYRGLAEQVYGQFLDGATTIADAVLRSDRVRARVEGIIHGAEVVGINPVGQDTYELTLSLDRDVVRELRALYLEETRAQIR